VDRRRATHGWPMLAARRDPDRVAAAGLRSESKSAHRRDGPT
jgi:hypothetical protein